MFQGDQGRDALVVSRIFTDSDLVFIGPVTSVGNMYLGPLYYYLMAPFLYLSYPSPVGPVYAVAILSILSCWLTFYVGKRMIGQPAALVAAILMSFSWVAVYHARFSWNPNPAPLVSLLLIYSTYLAWKKHPKYWLGVALSFAVLLQLHYLTILSIGGPGLIWLYQLKSNLSKRTKAWRSQLWYSIIAGLIILVSFTPLVLFDLKHNGLNLQAFERLLLVETNFKSEEAPGLLQEALVVVRETHGRSMHVLFDVWFDQHRTTNTLLVLIFVALVIGVLRKPSVRYHSGVVVLVCSTFVTIIGISFYKHTIFDHYILYTLPITALLIGAVFQHYWRFLVTKIALGLFLAFFIYANVAHYRLSSAGWTIADMAGVSQSIYEKLKSDDVYNLVLLSESHDINGQNYRYFLSTTDHPPVAEEDRGSVNTLVIINEDRKLAKVVDSPIYEIVVFPNKEPAQVYTISGGPEITILRTKHE